MKALAGIFLVGTASGAAYVATPIDDPFFVIGVDAQPPELLARWSRHGIDTAVRVVPGTTAETDATARGLGLRLIRPLADGEDGRDLPHLLAAASVSDEPELKHDGADEGVAEQAARYAATRVPERPFFTNYAGPWMLGDPFSKGDYCGLPGDRIGPECYFRYFAQTDWISFDHYPMNRVGDINEPARLVRRIRRHHAERGLPVPPVLAYVEASDFDCDGNGPTPGQIAYQAMHAVIAGVAGIIYFPHALRGCGRRSADGSTSEAKAAIAGVNAVLAGVPPATLRSRPDPFGVAMLVEADRGQVRTGSRTDDAYAWYLSANDHDERSVKASVTFQGIADCGGLDAEIVGDGPADPVVRLDDACRTVTPQHWRPREVRAYRIPLKGLTSSTAPRPRTPAR